MATLALACWPTRSRELFPGILACAVVAAATFLSQHYNAPVMIARPRGRARALTRHQALKKLTT